MDKESTKLINVALDPLLWRALSVVSAKLGLQKREAVSKAIIEYIERHDPDSLRLLNGKATD